MSEIIIGSHLTTPRTAYTHHGLYIGNQQVIHLTSNSKVETVSLDEFTNGHGYSEPSFHSKFSRQDIVKRAQSRLGNEDYSLVFNNCEHFVNWCLHDKPHSKQVHHVVNSIGNGVLNVAIRNFATNVIPSTTQTFSQVAGFRLLSPMPITVAAVVGFGVYKLVKWHND
jgi:hypothetical protein